MISKMIWLLLIGKTVEAKRKCTIENDLRTATTPCNPKTNKATAFFYYDKRDQCADEREEDPETGDLVKDGSDPIPPYFENYQCDHMCEDDGWYSTMDFKTTINQVCKQCPKNHISTRGGFILDAKMDDGDHIATKFSQHFKISCKTLSFKDIYNAE